jgi:hypothetical protein
VFSPSTAWVVSAVMRPPLRLVNFYLPEPPSRPNSSIPYSAAGRQRADAPAQSTHSCIVIQLRELDAYKIRGFRWSLALKIFPKVFPSGMKTAPGGFSEGRFTW